MHILISIVLHTTSLQDCMSVCRAGTSSACPSPVCRSLRALSGDDLRSASALSEAWREYTLFLSGCYLLSLFYAVLSPPP